MRIYYARPIFTPGERDYNLIIEKMIDDLEIERQEWGGKKENDTRSRAKRVFDSCFRWYRAGKFNPGDSQRRRGR